MTLSSMPLSCSLRRSLALCHDQGCPPLVVRSGGANIEIRRVDGSEPSVTEWREVLARVAAHKTNADSTVTARLRWVQVGDEQVLNAAE
ncbi:MAG: hypothetical protein EOO70_03415 [Myxococcaceae bacterium]|nr:MAG: hypothetical protein EOO70_03415 [Myxococcaceae bacterium]